MTRMESKMMVVLAVGAFMAPVMAQTDAGKADPGSHHPLSWIVSYSGISEIEQQKGGSEIARKLLAEPHTIIVAANPHRSEFNEAQRAVSVMSLDECKLALDKPSNADLKMLFVDLEAWSGTPQSDQENPQAATRRCHEWAHQNDRKITVIATPAMDLMSVIDPKHHGTQYDSAIRYDLEGKLASVSDAVDVQVENIEDDPERYERTLRVMVEQIKAARKGAAIPIYAGLSTGVVGKRISADSLARALQEDVRRTRDFVTGYWMAIPSKSLCPGCGDPNPQVAIKLLQSLGE